MEKDIDKLLSRTLFTYFIILFAVFALKLFGLNYFELDMNNKIINNINDFILYWKLENVWYFITLYINTFVIFTIACNDNSKKLHYFTLAAMPLNVVMQYIKSHYNFPFMFVFTDLLYLFILSLCYIKFIKREKVHKYNVTNYWLFMFINFIYQLISLITRNVTIVNQENLYQYLMISILLDIDYFVLLIMTYKLYFIKGGKDLWVWVHGYFSDLLISLKKLPRKFLTSYQNAKPKKREDKLAYKIYIVLFWLYNIFTVLVVLFIATLNETFIECIFILSSFWINKGVFGKPFHLKKASTCFIVSSLSYYVLNRLTWKVGISFLIPVVLGIALSYLTSKLMARRENLYLYKGMPLDKFYELITKVTNNQEHIEICKRYYVDKESNLKIALSFNYSEINIKKIKEKINKKIKELYK